VSELGEDGIIASELAPRFDEYFNRITPFGFSGAFLAAKDRLIIFNKGYGMAIREKGIPNTSETVFCIGSITKQFTAAAIMTLEMQGKLKTEHSINAYFDNVPKGKKRITLHHLLTHTAGIVTYTGEDYVVAYRDEIVQKALHAPLHFPSGTSYEYSNVGYSLLGAIVEFVSGQSYEEYLHEHLFKPSGMFSTGYRIPKWHERAIATWYVGQKSFRLSLSEHDQPHWNVIGNGEILSTTNDMHKWYLALKGEKILSAEAKRKMFTPLLNNYAYGWNVIDTEHGKIIQHDGGSDLGSSALFTWFVDHDVLTVLFCNQSYGEKTLNSVLRDKTEKLLFGKDVELPPTTLKANLSRMKSFEGAYKLPTEGQFILQIDAGYLTITAAGQDAANSLFSFSRESLSGLRDLTNRTVRMVNAVLRGDYEYCKRELNDEERTKSWRRLILDRLNVIENKVDQLETTVLGGLIWPRSQDTIEVVVKTRRDTDEFRFGLLWRNGKLWGLTTGPNTFVMRILPISRNSYVGNDLGTAKNAKLSFDTDKQGRVTRLVIHHKVSDLKASKV
jgi:CubicO group peptidase (beta-lactamase class C family)